MMQNGSYIPVGVVEGRFIRSRPLIPFTADFLFYLYLSENFTLALVRAIDI